LLVQEITAFGNCQEDEKGLRIRKLKLEIEKNEVRAIAAEM
jgi:hypothetical protein